jgi:hypothetical protein
MAAAVWIDQDLMVVDATEDFRTFVPHERGVTDGTGLYPLDPSVFRFYSEVHQ